MNELKHIEVFFRVPAGRIGGKEYASYLSSTRVFARSRSEAIACVSKSNPEYTELH